MKKKKKIIIAAAASAVLLVSVTGVIIWKHGSGNDDSTKVFVTPVSDINTVNSATSLSGQCFSGVIESQKTLDVKYDTSKQIKEILVKEGDQVEEGTELFTYDVDAMELQLEQGELEIEKSNNNIDSMKKQITQLQADKKNASSDDQYSYSAQIQSLETDISKAEYDIKVKNTELEKLKNSIKNATVKAEMAGTVKKINSVNSSDSSQTADGGDGTSGDVVMTIIASGDFRVKGKVNEQTMQAISTDMPVIIRSRIDDTQTWTGTVSEIGTEPEQDNNSDIYGGSSDEMTSSSSYPFYVKLDSIDGLILGQHVIIEPDSGQSDTTEKTGIWLYSDYIVTDDNGKTFVWAVDKKGRLEKKYVETGETDENYGDCQITSGLSDNDKIAYPSDGYEEGMSTTTDEEEANFEEESSDTDSDVNPDESHDENADDEGIMPYDENSDENTDGAIDGGDEPVFDENSDEETDSESGGILGGLLGGKDDSSDDDSSISDATPKG